MVALISHKKTLAAFLAVDGNIFFNFVIQSKELTRQNINKKSILLCHNGLNVKLNTTR